MALVKQEDHMVNDYKIGEGDMIGYMPTEFGTNGKLSDMKLVAGSTCKKGQIVALTDSLTVKPYDGTNGTVIGVAMFDVKAGEDISVEAEGLFKLKASAAVAVATSASVQAAADGTVAPLAEDGTKVGIALNDADADGYVFVKFSI